MASLISHIKKLLPAPLLSLARAIWHPGIAFISAVRHGFPVRTMIVIGVTGTKGKSTVSEMLFAILRAAGKSTALASTIRFAVDDDSTPNRFKMTMQGRGFLQAFLAHAKKRGATHAVVEITSEGARQYRNAFLGLDTLIVTNIQREHIESHGSFEKYVAAKRGIVKSLERSSKKRRTLVANADNEFTARFLEEVRGVEAVPFSEKELAGGAITLPIPGVFNQMNALAALKAAKALGISRDVALRALKKMPPVLGRLERIECGQPFGVIVDYAHTPDSLAALYGAYSGKKKVCVLGNTGGGRDIWKRPEMGRIADEACETVILTNEDPYDENPRKIADEMAAGMKRRPEIIMDRREAIREALRQAQSSKNQNDIVVLVSGKGTDPYIMVASGKKIPWSDAAVAKEELRALGFEG